MTNHSVCETLFAICKIGWLGRLYATFRQNLLVPYFSDTMNFSLKICFCFLITSHLFCCKFALAQIDGVKSFTQPYRSIDLAVGEMGKLYEVLVKEGDEVSQGEVVARLDEKVLEKSRAIAADNKTAKGKLHSAQAELRMQKERYQKIEGLLQRKHASQNELDRARGQLEIAEAQLETVKDELRIRALELERIEAQIEERRLRSPINGVVTKIFKEPGEFVSASDPTVATVVQLDPLLVVFLVPQKRASSYRAHQNVQVEVGNRETLVQGVIEFISPIDAQSGTRRIKVKIPNSNFKLESGQVCYLKQAIRAKTASSRQFPEVADN